MVHAHKYAFGISEIYLSEILRAIFVGQIEVLSKSYTNTQKL